jgi:thymidylate synthase (FAD)
MIKVLDGAGSVELIGTFGDDLTVVNAARVSFAKESTVMEPRDAKLIKYLADHNHTTPFFHPQIRLRLKMPIFVAREWFRHTVGFARNEVSRRYVDYEPECYEPQDHQIRAKDVNKKQGSKAESVEGAEVFVEKIKEIQAMCIKAYNEFLEAGVAPEIARGVLPQSMYTEFIETGSLAAYARLCQLRCDPQAQKEIQEYAQAVSDLLEPRFPVSWSALKGQWSSSQHPNQETTSQ